MQIKTVILGLFLAVLSITHASADSQKTMGDCSPAVKTKGNVNIICGSNESKVLLKVLDDLDKSLTIKKELDTKKCGDNYNELG